MLLSQNNPLLCGYIRLFIHWLLDYCYSGYCEWHGHQHLLARFVFCFHLLVRTRPKIEFLGCVIGVSWVPFSSQKACRYYCISSSPFSDILIMCVLYPLKLSHGSCMLRAWLIVWLRVISSFPSLFPPACQFGDFCWPSLASLLLPQLYWADCGFSNGGLHLAALDALCFFLIPCLAFLLTVPNWLCGCLFLPQQLWIEYSHFQFHLVIVVAES